MIKICVDSAADFSLETIKSHDLFMVPLQVILDDTTYLDSVTLFKDEFYDKLVNENGYFKTSQPSPSQFLEVFEQVKASNDTLIVITLSSALSGTYQSATLAKSIIDYDNIYIVDSLTATAGVQLLVHKTIEMIEAGQSIDEIVEELETVKEHIHIYASVDTLEYLARGGRIGKAAAAIGEIAKIKPIIHVYQDGAVDIAGKKIGINQSAKFIVDNVINDGIHPEYPLYSLVSYGDGNAEKLESKLNEAGIECASRVQIGPTIGTHIGPKAFGVAFVEKF